MKMIFFRLSAIFAALFVSSTLFGFRPISVAEVKGEKDVAIKGYDTVAYFVSGEAVPGRAIFRHEWQGAYWYFSNAGHRKSFAADPHKYAPAYGGYCGYCVNESGEAATGGDPEIFLIHKERLYLLQSEEVAAEWKQDIERYTREADAVYASLLKRGPQAGTSQ